MFEKRILIDLVISGAYYYLVFILLIVIKIIVEIWVKEVMVVVTEAMMAMI